MTISNHYCACICVSVVRVKVLASVPLGESPNITIAHVHKISCDLFCNSGNFSIRAIIPRQ